MKTNNIAQKLILTAEGLSGVSLEQIRNDYAVNENNRKDYLTEFDKAVEKIRSLIGGTTDSADVTAAKAAAYDRTKELVGQFAAKFNKPVTCEAELDEVLQILFTQYEKDATAFGGVNPIQYAQNLSELCRAKDKEIATLKQQLQSLQPNGGIILP